ncbi:MAG: MerR family transcriptional regulator [Solirubrobacterales bacterium]|nr:MerR family transcriptional regulator [Solirubrobacterales bacterium]
MDKGGQTLSVTEFAAMTGVSRERLRTWERRYGFPRPVRVAGGRRRYLAADVGRVVAVRRAAEDGVPLAVAVEQSASPAAPAVGAGAFEAAVDRAPVPVALVSGPAPLRLEHANAALRALPGAPAPGDDVEHLAALREHFTRDLPPGEVEHPAWGGEGVDRSLAYRLPAGPGEPPMVAVVGIGSSRARGAPPARRP